MPVGRQVVIPPRVVGDTVCFADVPGVLGRHCKIRSAPRGGCDATNNPGATLLGPATRLSYVARKCACNALACLRLRHGIPQPTVSCQFDVAYHFDAGFSTVKRVYADLNRGPAEWLCKWPLAKRKNFLRSFLFDLVQPGRVHLMVKREGGHERPKRPRGIQMYPNLATQAFVGDRVYALQHATTSVFRGLRFPHGDVTIACGQSPAALASWLLDRRDGAWGYLERDGKDWDSTMQSIHSNLRIRWYAMVDAAVAKFAENSVDVRGVAYTSNGPLRYSVNGTVKSGHNDTTLGNSLVNAAIAYEALAAVGCRGSILVAGDDLVIALADQCDLGAYLAREVALGIKPAARIFRSYQSVSFLSAGWYDNGDSVVFAPRVGRLLARLWWTVNPPPLRVREAYLRSVAACVTSSCGDMPILSSWVSWAVSEGPLVTLDKLAMFRGAAVEWAPNARLQFAQRYGLLTADLDEAESFIRSLPRAPCVVAHPVLEVITDYDTCDIAGRQDRGGPLK